MLSIDYSELDAVNIILRAAGEQPVAGLDDSAELVEEVTKARQTLTQSLMRLQAQGYSFNRETISLPIEVSGTIPVPPDVFSLRSTDPYKSYRLQDNKVYDYENRTDVFTGTTSVSVEVVRYVGFERCPLELREYATWLAARSFEQEVRGSPEANQRTMEQIGVTKAAWMSWVANDTQANINDTYRQNAIVGKRYHPVNNWRY